MAGWMTMMSDWLQSMLLWLDSAVSHSYFPLLDDDLLTRDDIFLLLNNCKLLMNAYHNIFTSLFGSILAASRTAIEVYLSLSSNFSSYK